MRACAIETHVKISQEPLCTEIYGKNAAAQNLGAHCVRACAVETRVKISQEPLYAAICRSNAADQREHPDQAPAFTLFVRTPQGGHTVWGMMLHSLFSETDIFEKCPRNRRLLRMIASETTQKHWKKNNTKYTFHDEGFHVISFKAGAAPSYVYVYV